MWPSYRNVSLLNNSVKYRSSFTFTDKQKLEVNIDFGTLKQTRQRVLRNIRGEIRPYAHWQDHWIPTYRWKFTNTRGEWIDYDEESNKIIDEASRKFNFHVKELNRNLFDNFDKIKLLIDDDFFCSAFINELDTGDDMWIHDWQKWASERGKAFPLGFWDKALGIVPFDD
jgi:hypothetical protein